uniref:Uncharacterized protein n=1 Tax=Varanus komodoensis TaxID=61221 RepID=A0A8D2IWM6_VARKO
QLRHRCRPSREGPFDLLGERERIFSVPLKVFTTQAAPWTPASSSCFLHRRSAAGRERWVPEWGAAALAAPPGPLNPSLRSRRSARVAASSAASTPGSWTSDTALGRPPCAPPPAWGGSVLGKARRAGGRHCRDKRAKEKASTRPPRMQLLLASRIRPLFISSTRQLKNRVPEYQKLFQEDNGLPVHLKGGTKDNILYRITMSLCVFGGAFAVFELFRPRK